VYRRVVTLKLTDVSESRTASIIRAMNADISNVYRCEVIHATSLNHKLFFVFHVIEATLDYPGRISRGSPPSLTNYDVLQRIRARLCTDFGLPLFVTAAC
jgi:hypothetical protein